MADDQEAILKEAKSQPYDIRIAHKSWFVKAAAYDDIAADCKKALDPTDNVFHDTGTLFVKGVADTNPNVVDKALDALLAYLESCSEAAANRIAGPTCIAVASKTLKGRPGTVKKATDVMLAFLEWEKVEEVLEPVFNAFKDKVPKVVIAAVDLISQAFSQFGPGVVKPQMVAKALPSVFNAKQEAVREAVKKIAVEMQGYLGRQYVEGSLCDKMPAIMRKDVEKLLDDNASLKLTPQRFTRKEQEARAAQTAQVQANGAVSPGSPADGAAEPAGTATEDVENMAYEYAEPAEILSSLNKEFWAGLAAKKWTERKESLLKLKALASQPRLQPGDYGDVLRELKKIIQKDSMVVIVGEAILCVGALSKSLRTNFSSSARQFVSVILEKYKDPKTSVSMAVTEALTQIHKYSLSLSDSAEDLCAALDSKNPKVKADTARLLQACIGSADKKEAVKLNSCLLPTVAKAANDPAPDVREANMGVLVALASKSGNKALLEKVSTGWDEARKKRLMELAGSASTDGKDAVNVSLQIPPLSRSARTSPRVSPRMTSRTSALPSAGSGAAKPAMKKAGPKKAGPSAGPAAEPTGAADDDDSALSGGTLSETEAKEKMQVLLGDEIFKGLQDSQWKARVQSMEGVMGIVKDMQDVSADTACSLIQGLAFLPGWSEKNFQVLALAFGVVAHLVSTGMVNKKAAFIAMGGLVDKMSDIKLKGPSGEALFAIAENISPQFVFTQLHKKAAGHKNPKVLSESLIWMAKAIEDFGLAVFNVGQLIEWGKADLSSTNAGVRNAAVQLMAVSHKQLGPSLASMLRSDVKPALMTALEEAFKKNPQTQVVPTRAVKTAKPKAAPTRGSTSGTSAAEQADTQAVFDPDALLPRTDISPLLGSKVIASLGSANWKERNSTMEDIENIIRSAVRIQPTVGELVSALKARLTDSNKNLVARALSLYGELGKAMGPAWEKVGRPILQQCVSFVGDNKKQVRDAAVGMLDAWVSVVPADRLVPSLVDFLAHPKASTDGKVTCLKWLMALVESQKAGTCAESIIKAISLALGDKSGETREAGTKLGLAISQAYPREAREAVARLPPAAQKPVKDLLDRQSGGAQPDTHVASRTPPQASPRPAAPGNAGSFTSRSLRTSPSKTLAPPTARAAAPQTGVSAEGPCLTFSSKKDERTHRARFKGSKFDVPGPSDVEQLMDEFEGIASSQLKAALFAKDFKKHMEACDLILSQLPGAEKEVMSCLDLLLQWIVVRICEANTQCLLKVLELLTALFTLMIDQEYQMADSEVNTILPCLIEKSGHNQERLRSYNKELIEMARRLVSVPRMVEALLQGLNSKSMRTKVDCIEIMDHMIEEEGLSAVNQTRQKPVAAIAQRVSDRDKSIRSAVLSLMEGVLKRDGEKEVWRQAGNLTDQQKSLIEERFKFVHKAEAKIAEKASPTPRSVAGSRRQSYTGSQTPQVERCEAIHDSRPPIDTRPVHAALNGLPVPGAGQAVLAAPSVPPATPVSRLPSHIPGVSSIPTPVPGKPAANPSPAPSDLVQMDTSDDNDVHYNFELALTMLTRDGEEGVEGAKRMCYVLQSAASEDTSQEFLMFLAHHATELLKIVTIKVDEVFEQTIEEVRSTGDPVNPRACKYFINVIMMFTDVKAMLNAVAVEELENLMFVLLVRMLDQDVQNIMAGTPVVRALNVLMMKILSDKFGNDTFEALIQLLNTAPAVMQDRGVSIQDFCGLISKCLVRLTKMLQERHSEIDMHQLLMVIHHYFMSLGVDEIRRMGTQDEKSLKIVKNILHVICKLKGDEVRSLLHDVPRNMEPPPMIWVYVDLNLETLHESGFFGPSNPSVSSSGELQENGQSHNVQEGLPKRATSTSLPSPASSDRIPTASATITARSRELKPKTSLKVSPSAPKAGSAKSQTNLKAMLVPILQKIGASETSEEGLRELREFMIENPEVDRSQFFSLLSPDFCAFVDKGLSRLDRRSRAEQALNKQLAATDANSEGQMPNGSGAYIASQARDLENRMSKVRIGGEPLKDGEQESLPTMTDIAQLRERLRLLQQQDSSA